MDEKELMIPLELGYVQEAKRKNPLMKWFALECVAIFCHSQHHIHTW